MVDKKKHHHKKKGKDEKKEDENGTPAEPPPPTPPFSRLFSFATQLDMILIVIGIISSAAAGINTNLLIMKENIDIF